ncbi:hypothetical protein JNM05_11465 [bacterium]|nr:hypothetical protein [bacterium]
MIRFLITLLCLAAAYPPLFAQKDIRDVTELIAETTVSNLQARYANNPGTVRIGVFNLDRQVLNEANLTYSIFENYVTDQIIIGLMNNKARIEFDVVERGSLEKVLLEQQLAISDLVDQSKSVQAGKLLNASVILTGSYQVLPEHIQITMKLTDVQTGSLITAMSYEIKIDNRVDNLLGIKDEMAFHEKSRQRQKELNQRIKGRSQSFFGGGMSLMYLNSSGKTDIDHYAGTLDVSFGYRRVVTSIGYGYYSYKYDLRNNHYLLAGLSIRIISFLRLGYMVGFPLDKDNSLGQTVSSGSQTAHYLKWTAFELRQCDISLNYAVINKRAFAQYSNNTNFEFWGLGLSFH